MFVSLLEMLSHCKIFILLLNRCIMFIHSPSYISGCLAYIMLSTTCAFNSINAIVALTFSIGSGPPWTPIIWGSICTYFYVGSASFTAMSWMARIKAQITVAICLLDY